MGFMSMGRGTACAALELELQLPAAFGRQRSTSAAVEFVQPAVLRAVPRPGTGATRCRGAWLRACAILPYPVLDRSGLAAKRYSDSSWLIIPTGTQTLSVPIACVGLVRCMQTSWDVSGHFARVGCQM